MTSQEIEQLNELSNVALDGEVRFRLMVASLKGGNIPLSKLHLEQAEKVCQRVSNGLLELENKYGEGGR
jgi:hypothetical protein